MDSQLRAEGAEEGDRSGPEEHEAQEEEQGNAAITLSTTTQGARVSNEASVGSETGWVSPSSYPLEGDPERQEGLLEYLSNLARLIVRTSGQQVWMRAAAEYLLKQLRLLGGESAELLEVVRQLEDFLFQKPSGSIESTLDACAEEPEQEAAASRSCEVPCLIRSKISELQGAGIDAFVFGDEPRDFQQFDTLASDMKRLYEKGDMRKLTIVYLKLFRRIRGAVLPNSILEAYYLARIDQRSRE